MVLTHFRHKMRWFGLRFTVVGTTVKVTQAPRVLVGFGSSKVKVSVPRGCPPDPRDSDESCGLIGRMGDYDGALL